MADVRWGPAMRAVLRETRHAWRAQNGHLTDADRRLSELARSMDEAWEAGGVLIA